MRTVAIGSGLMTMVCAGLSFRACVGLPLAYEPADVANAKQWQDERIRFAYPGNWEVEPLPAPSDQVKQYRVHAPDDAVVIVSTYVPASVLAPDVELDSLLFAAGRAETGPRTELQRTLLGVEATGRATTARWAFGPLSLTLLAHCFTANDLRMDRSASVCTELVDATAPVVDPGVGLILDTLTWAAP